MDELLNNLDWDNKNPFNEGVQAFEFTVENASSLATAMTFFDGNGVASDASKTKLNPADNFLLPAESSCSNESVAAVSRTRDLNIRQMQYKVVSIGGGGSVQDQFDKRLEFCRGAIDGSVKRKGDIQPGFERRNWMYQEDFIIIPGPFTITGDIALFFDIAAFCKVNLLFEVDSIGQK